MNIVNKVKVNICGKEYNLQTDETPEYISALARRVDKEINDLVKLKPNFGIQNAAVFVALTSLDEASKASGSIENIRAQIKSSVDEAAKARSAKEKLTERIKELEARVAELEKENKELKKCAPAFECEQLVLENTISPAVTVYAGEMDTEEKKDETASEEKPQNDKNKSESAENGSSCASTDCKADEKADCEESASADRGGASEAQGDGADTSDNDVTAAENGKHRNKRKKR